MSGILESVQNAISSLTGSAETAREGGVVAEEAPTQVVAPPVQEEEKEAEALNNAVADVPVEVPVVAAEAATAAPKKKRNPPRRYTIVSDARFEEILRANPDCRAAGPGCNHLLIGEEGLPYKHENGKKVICKLPKRAATAAITRTVTEYRWLPEHKFQEKAAANADNYQVGNVGCKNPLLDEDDNVYRGKDSKKVLCPRIVAAAPRKTAPRKTAKERVYHDLTDAAFVAKEKANMVRRHYTDMCPKPLKNKKSREIYRHIETGEVLCRAADAPAAAPRKARTIDDVSPNYFKELRAENAGLVERKRCVNPLRDANGLAIRNAATKMLLCHPPRPRTKKVAAAAAPRQKTALKASEKFAPENAEHQRLYNQEFHHQLQPFFMATCPTNKRLKTDGRAIYVQKGGHYHYLCAPKSEEEIMAHYKQFIAKHRS